MFAWMNREALQKTAELGRAVYFSRSRGKLWFKGEESGHVQTVHEIRLDCDNDVLLLKVTQLGHEPGIACHTGRHSCFFTLVQRRRLGWCTEPVLKDPDIHLQKAPANSPNEHQRFPQRLAHVIESRLAANGGDPATSYVARLLHKGPDAFLKKIGEEATETVMAAKDRGPRRRTGQKVVNEIADLWFHTMIALAHYGLRPADVIAELERREGTSGIEEKALRKAVLRDEQRRSPEMSDIVDVQAIDSEKAQSLKTVGWVSYVLHLIVPWLRGHSRRAGWCPCCSSSRWSSTS